MIRKEHDMSKETIARTLFEADEKPSIFLTVLRERTTWGTQVYYFDRGSTDGSGFNQQMSLDRALQAFAEEVEALEAEYNPVVLRTAFRGGGMVQIMPNGRQVRLPASCAEEGVA